ncbi:unnamed protein product, partial [Didymodactylos carnosus]
IVQQNCSPVYINNQQSSSSITTQQKQSISPSSNYNQLHNTSPIKSLTDGDTVTSLLNTPTSSTSTSSSVSAVLINNPICQLDNHLLLKNSNLITPQEQTRQQFIQPFNYHCHYYQQQQHPFLYQQRHQYRCETNMITNHDNKSNEQHIIHESLIPTNLSPQQSSISDLDETTPPKLNIAIAKIIKKKKPPKKKRKDPNEPQKPVSPYALFFRDTQNEIKKKLANPTFGEISKVVAHMWENIEPEVKEQYKRKAAAAKKEYLKQLAAYRAVQVSHQTPSMHLLGPNTSIYNSNPPPSVQNFSQTSRNENNHLGQHHHVVEQQRFGYHRPHQSHMQHAPTFCNQISAYNRVSSPSLIQKQQQQHPYHHYHDYLVGSSTPVSYLNESLPQNNNNNYSYTNGESQMYHQSHQFETAFQCDMTYDQQQQQQHFGLLRPVDCGESFYCVEESENQTQQQTLTNCGEISNHNLLHDLTTLTPVIINPKHYTDLNPSTASIKCSPSMQNCAGDKQNFITNYQNNLIKCEDFNQTSVDSVNGNYYAVYNADQGGAKSEGDIKKIYGGQKEDSTRSSNDYHGWNNSCLALNAPW